MRSRRTINVNDQMNRRFLKNGVWIHNANAGTDQESSTASTTVTRMTSQVLVIYPFYVETVLWDIYAASTYTLRLVTTLTGTTLLKNIAVSKTLASGENIIIVPDLGPFFLPSGRYYFQLALDSGGARWYRNNVTTFDAGLFILEDMAYDASASTQVAPMRLVGSYLNVPFNP